MNWRFHSIAEFAQFAPAWRELHGVCGQRGGLLEPDFVVPLIALFATGRELLAVRQGSGGVDCMAVLAKRRHGLWETLQPAQSPFGLWLHRPELSFARLLPELQSALPGFALGVAVTQQDPDVVPRPQDAVPLATLDYIRTARVAVDGSFEAYWSRRGKNLRQNVKRQKSALAKEGVRPHLDILLAPEDVAAAVRDYAVLESAGWKAAQDTAIRADNAQGRFYLEMLMNFARRGRARVYRYRFGERVVAVDLCIESDGELAVLKTTYDETIRSVSPATLLRHDYFQALFGEGRVKRIEFYGRVMEWHTRWTDEVRTMYHVNCYRWPWLPRLRSLLGHVGSGSTPNEETSGSEAKLE